MKAGFIGYRNFAAKLWRFFSQSRLVDDFIFFHPNKTITELVCTNSLEQLFSCDFVVIASPDWTHGEYLRALQNYEGYIFCEKIPVLSREDLAFLKKKINPRLYFNFNYRQSCLFDLIRSQQGNLLHFHHSMSHGIALRDEYKNNWRSNSSKAPLGVFQLSGIHFFDLLVFCLGRPLSYHISARNVSNYGDSIDNFAISIKFKKEISADLFFSYTSPFRFDVSINTTEHLYEYNGREFVIKGIGESLDNKERFSTAPVISKETIDIYDDSLNCSVEYFLKVVTAKSTFQETASDKNLLSTELFLDILDEVTAGRK